MIVNLLLLMYENERYIHMVRKNKIKTLFSYTPPDMEVKNGGT